MLELRIGRSDDLRSCHDQISTGGETAGPTHVTHNLTQSSTNPVPDHSLSHAPADAEGDPDRPLFRSQMHHCDGPPPYATALAVQFLEGPAVTDSLDQADRRARPR